MGPASRPRLRTSASWVARWPSLRVTRKRGSSGAPTLAAMSHRGTRRTDWCWRSNSCTRSSWPSPGLPWLLEPAQGAPTNDGYPSGHPDAGWNFVSFGARVVDGTPRASREAAHRAEGSVARSASGTRSRRPRLQGQVQAVAARAALARISAAGPARGVPGRFSRARGRRELGHSVRGLRTGRTDRLGVLPGVDDDRDRVADQQSAARSVHPMSPPRVPGGRPDRLTARAGRHWTRRARGHGGDRAPVVASRPVPRRRRLAVPAHGRSGGVQLRPDGALQGHALRDAVPAAGRALSRTGRIPALRPRINSARARGSESAHRADRGAALDGHLRIPTVFRTDRRLARADPAPRSLRLDVLRAQGDDHGGRDLTWRPTA